MWVAPAPAASASDAGCWRARAAGGASNPVVRLETNATLEKAIRLYRSSGYVEVPPSTARPTPITGSRSASLRDGAGAGAMTRRGLRRPSNRPETRRGGSGEVGLLLGAISAIG